MKTMKRLILMSMIATVISIANYAFANNVKLTKIGEIQSQNGSAYYLPGKLFVSGQDGVKSLFTDKKHFKGARSLTPSARACQFSTANVNMPLENGESVAMFANTSVGDFGNVSVAVVRLNSEAVDGDVFNYKPIEVRVLDGNNVIAKYKMDFDVYPCALVVDHFTGKNTEQQIALSWISVGNGYSAGLTVLNLTK